MSVSKSVRIDDPSGFHIRPAQLFQETASRFPCDIRVKTEDGRQADAKSVLGLMMLGLAQGDSISIEADGEGAEEAVETLVSLIRGGFGDSS